MFNDDCVGNARYALSFIEADRGQQGPGGYKQNPLPGAVLYLWEDVGTQGYGGTAASASACMGVLLFLICLLYTSDAADD